MSNQVKSLSVFISADAINCYDLVTHPFISLTTPYFGVHINYILVLLKAIQNMTMHLQTTFGVSASSYSGSVLTPFQEAVKGNRIAPFLWIMISIISIWYVYLLGLVSKNYTPISGIIFHLTALIYVDDTDLNVLKLKQKSTLEAIWESRSLLIASQFSLEVSGGELKLEKCVWTLKNYEWKKGVKF